MNEWMEDIAFNDRPIDEFVVTFGMLRNNFFWVIYLLLLFNCVTTECYAKLAWF